MVRTVSCSRYSLAGNAGVAGVGAGVGYRLTQPGSLLTVQESELSSRMVGEVPSFFATQYSLPVTTDVSIVPTAPLV